jgi:hypothetical protein
MYVCMYVFIYSPHLGDLCSPVHPRSEEQDQTGASCSPLDIHSSHTEAHTAGVGVLVSARICGLAVRGTFEEERSSLKWGVGRNSPERFADDWKATNPEL